MIEACNRDTANRKKFVHVAIALTFAFMLIGAATGPWPLTQNNVASAQTPSTWAKTIGTTSTGNEDLWRGLELACEGDGLIIAAHTNGTGAGRNDTLLVKMLFDGTVAWNRTIGGPKNDIPREIQATRCGQSDAGYIIVGQTQTNATGTFGKNDIWAMRLNSTGFPIWNKNYGTIYADTAHAVAQYPNASKATHYLVGGHISTGNVTADRDFYLMKIKQSDGTIVGEKSWNASGGDDSIRDLLILNTTGNQNKVLVAGFKKSSAGETGDEGDIWLIKVNATSNSLFVDWRKIYGGTEYEEPAVIIEKSDGSLIIMEETSSFNATNRDAWLFQVNSTGHLQTSPQKRWHGNGTEDLIEEFSAATLTGTTIITAGQYEQTSSNRDVWLVKLNATTGGKIWEYRFGGSGTDEAEDMVLLPDGRIAILGYTTSSSLTSGKQDILLMLVASNGQLSNCTSAVSTVNDATPASKSNNTSANSTSTNSVSNYDPNIAVNTLSMTVNANPTLDIRTYCSA
ncbi:MAG: hypothetical protein HMLIMOIP_002374 [Candidatus Nitrosomirales archaeon]|jgi:hypothetical protein